MDKENIKNDRTRLIEIAEENFLRGYSCSQAVFSAFAPCFDLSPQLAFKIASAFGGGMGRTGGVCGAVSGSFLVLGLAKGPSDDTQLHLKEQVYERVRVFKEIFENKCGSIICNRLLDCDISTEEGRERARIEGRFDRCPEFVSSAVDILVSLL